MAATCPNAHELAFLKRRFSHRVGVTTSKPPVFHDLPIVGCGLGRSDLDQAYSRKLQLFDSACPTGSFCFAGHSLMVERDALK